MKQVEVIKAKSSLKNRSFNQMVERLRVAAYCRVSTDNEDQLNSYKSQVQHYTDYINGKQDWALVDIYADEAVTGTQTKKREDFQRLINDCLNCNIDMVITKSISRFARNTLDTLKYVRMLKEKNVAVFFEEENINTLTMDGELLLVILSSVAQQEVENISANVKKGLKMKMQRGELVGFQGCLGYDYHSENKSISINNEEAEIVKYIFNRYVEGAGCLLIGQELERLGYKTKRGNNKWAETTVMGIIKNEKYKGDIRQGKTFTLDPISKRRLDNFGEEDQFYIKNHHEPIISEDVFEMAQQILLRRSKNKKSIDGKREKYSRKYPFSSMLECGFCESNLSRRSWHSGSEYQKIIWQCITNTKKGKKFCPDAKGIAEDTIEQAFLESYRLLCINNKDVMDDLLKRIEDTLCANSATRDLTRIEKEILSLEQKRKKLVDMRLEDIIDKETYEVKYYELASKLALLNNEKVKFKDTTSREQNIKKRIVDFRKVLEQNDVLTEFDRYVFESIVDKVIVGGYDDDGNKDPSMLTFIYKTGFTNNIDGNIHKPERKNSKQKKVTDELCSYTGNEDNDLCSNTSNDTCGVGSSACTE
ncbi:recombinase family protein [Paenibacillus silviterrae]|uniref:recombinase family protein n=1 Tax=Paenibacillus silviterrae TaxID=3242194 RepID=UPI002543649F|nr:recombinase family protein [Paenibacillus chinjuensis]